MISSVGLPLATSLFRKDNRAIVSSRRSPAQEMFDRLVAQMKEAEGVTEQLKAENQMEWVGRMNSIRSRAEEIVLTELVYE